MKRNRCSSATLVVERRAKPNRKINSSETARRDDKNRFEWFCDCRSCRSFEFSASQFQDWNESRDIPPARTERCGEEEKRLSRSRPRRKASFIDVSTKVGLICINNFRCRKVSSHILALFVRCSTLFSVGLTATAGRCWRVMRWRAVSVEAEERFLVVLVHALALGVAVAIVAFKFSLSHLICIAKREHQAHRHYQATHTEMHSEVFFSAVFLLAKLFSV